MYKAGLGMLKVVGLLLCSLCTKADDFSSFGLLATLEEAKDHLQVKPSKTQMLLQQNLQYISALTAPEQIDWHLTMGRAAQQLSNLPQVKSSIEQLLQLHQEPAFAQRVAEIVNLVGVWLRKSGYPKAARFAYSCALQHYGDKRKQLSMLSNIAVAYRNEQNIAQFIRVNRLAYQMASQIEFKLLLAVLDNNLGSLYLNQQQYQLASRHFLDAMNQNQMIARRAGTVVSGLNLLLSYLYQQQYQNYQRLLPRIKRLLQDDTYIARQAYLQLLEGLYQHRKAQPLSESDQRQLHQAYAQLNDTGLQKTLLPLANELHLGIQLPTAHNQQHYQGNWLLKLEQCQWENYEKIDYIQKLINIS